MALKFSIPRWLGGSARQAPAGSGRALVVRPSGLVNFAGGDPALAGEIATRQAALGYYGQFSLFLPNPDPVLRNLGKSIQVYRDLRTTPSVGGAIRRRKSAVLSMERGLDRAFAKTRVAKNVEAILADLPLARILGQILNAPLYGYQPLEVMWARSGSFLVPADVVGKPPEWFVFGQHNEPRFRSLNNPLGEALPPRKFLLPRQDPTYENPYGFPDLSMVFWPVSFLKGGLGFFVKAAEKFGAPWPVGTYPRGTPDDEVEALLDALERMIQDGVAAVADDESVKLLESAKANPAEMYTELLKWCRSEINIALLGQNQTTEAESNRASAKAGAEVAKDIRDGDADIAAEALTQLVRWIVDLNFGDGQAAPKYEFWEQEEVDEVQAGRDKTLTEAGVKFTRSYWLRTYNLQESDLAPDPVPPVGNGDLAQFAGVDPEVFPDQAALDAAIQQLADDGSLQAQAEQLLAPVLKAVREAQDETEVLAALAEAYPDMRPDDLVNTLTRLIFAAGLVGRLEAQGEMVDG
jgi:phage gp29-like protein